MPRFVIPLLALAMLFAGLMAATGVQVTAQEATPAGDDGMMMEGVGFQVLGYGTADTLPAAPADMQLFRLFIEPGATFPLDPADPGTGIAFVEAGAVQIIVAAPMTVLRAAEAGAPFPEVTEEFAADTEFTMNMGDSAVFPPSTGGEVRNDGSEPAAILVANVTPGMAGMGEDANAEATPAS